MPLLWWMELDFVSLKDSAVPRSVCSGVYGLDMVLGASKRCSARGKGHEEGGSTYAKARLSLRSPPRNPRASTPITRACLLYYFVLSSTPLTL